MPEFLNSSIGLKLTVQQVIQEIIRFMKDDERRQYRITIGTDSESLTNGGVDFVSAVVIHRVGNGGRYFWRRHSINEKFYTMRDRIIKEVLISLDIAKEVLALLKRDIESLKEHAMLNWEFEIHADIGENGETKQMIKELVAMIRANNFEARTKPASYAASNVADRHI